MTSIKMQSFLEFVNIRKRNKEWQFMADGYLPLSPSILKEFEVDVQGVYHVTTIWGLQKLARLEGRRIDVAGFTKSSKGLSQGLLADAEVLVTLDGKSSINFQRDANTRTDRNGIRWLSPGGNISKPLNDIVYQFKVEILKKIVKNFIIPKADKRGEELFGIKSKLPDDIAVSNWIHDKDGKTKREFIKSYHQEAKKIINKSLIDKINNAVKWSDYEKFSHDEVLVHNFKIVNSKLIRSSDPDKAEKMWKNAEAAGMTNFDVIDQADVENL